MIVDEHDARVAAAGAGEMGLAVSDMGRREEEERAMTALMLVPAADESMASSPPTASMRSRMLRSPMPWRE
jgi:hypothetical protein